MINGVSGGNTHGNTKGYGVEVYIRDTIRGNGGIYTIEEFSSSE